MKAEKVFAADLTYNLNLPYVKARLSGYYTTIEDQSKVISFYDDSRGSFTNFAMSGIDKRHYGVELGLSVPVWNGLSVVGALSWGDYTYTSNPDFVQTVDNIDKIVLKDGSTGTVTTWRVHRSWLSTSASITADRVTGLPA